jgi:hypothetical protein
MALKILMGCYQKIF